MLQEDVELRKAVIGTLSRIGPGAVTAIPILQAARGDPELVAEADAALEQITPPRWAALRPHLVGTLPTALLITGATAILAGVTATLVWLADSMRPGHPLAWTLGTAIGLLGGFLGAMIGGIARGRGGAIVGLVILGAAGYGVGIFIGGWASSLLGPLGH
jgi:hypothetical protein